jgi:hypothetical protein
MRVKVQKLGDGLHPSEIVIAVATADGRARLVVDRKSLAGDSLEIGYPLRQQEGFALIELPRETSTGTWRVWVPTQNLIDSLEGAA